MTTSCDPATTIPTRCSPSWRRCERTASTATSDFDAAERDDVLTALDDAIAHGGQFVQRRVDAGEPGFVAMWQQMGGMKRFDRRRRWWRDVRPRFAAALS